MSALPSRLRAIAAFCARRPYLVILAALIVALASAAWRVGPWNVFLTHDQRGRLLMERGRYEAPRKRSEIRCGSARLR